LSLTAPSRAVTVTADNDSYYSWTGAISRIADTYASARPGIVYLLLRIFEAIKRRAMMDSLPKLGFRKRAFFFSIMFLIVLISVEATAQFLYRVRYGRIETFHAGSFQQAALDARHVTTIPNFSDPDFFGVGVGMSIDGSGFRRGAQSTNPGCPSVVFIGDSVPFGWGVSDRLSMPSKLFEYLQKADDPRCVINAAIPAYSLFQAVARFKHEISGKFKTDSVYLQIYDPVFGFVHFGSQWRPEIDWFTEPAISSIPYVKSAAIVEKALRYFGLLKKFRYDGYFEKSVTLDQSSLDRFRLEIRNELEHLHQILVHANVTNLIVAPITVPSSAYLRLPEEYRIAIEALNDEFRKFAEKHKDTIFLDTIGLLKAYSDQDVFRDECCHLTERGNGIVAEQVFEILRK
jgi:hypothetical protein